MRKLLWAMIAALLLPTCSAHALKITSRSSGNIFTANTPIAVDVEGAQGSVKYDITDYFGKRVGGGDSKESTITLPITSPGWYQLVCHDSRETAVVSIGVLIDREDAKLPSDGHVCVDVAGAWLLNPKDVKPIARIVRMAGIPWVRERILWSDVEKASGEYSWGKYDAVASAWAS